MFDTCLDVKSGVHRVFISVPPTEVLWGFADVVESHRILQYFTLPQVFRTDSTQTTRNLNLPVNVHTDSVSVRAESVLVCADSMLVRADSVPSLQVNF
jgi:hypothetical protein